MAELLLEAWHEITGKPVIFIAEVVQFLLLMGLLVYFGRKIISNRLSARREGIVAELAEAKKGLEELAEAEKEVKTTIAQAKRDARQIIANAQEEADKARDAAIKQMDLETHEIIRQAERTVENEKTDVINEAAQQLVSLVSVASRRFIEEELTESERRDLTQNIILSGLGEIETVSLPE